MTRDPSDGSVKEKPKIETSGLPISREKADELLRLEQSRQWLKVYLEASNFTATGGTDGAIAAKTQTASGLSINRGADR